MKNFKIKFILIFICLFTLFIPKVNAQVEDVSNPDEGYTHTFIFYNGGEVWETSILKNDEVLTQPANPSRENQVFVGWYKDSNFTEVFDGFNQPATLDDGETILYAKFKQVFYVTYLDTNNNVILTEKIDENASYTITSNEPLFVIENPKQKSIGWKDQDGNEYTNTQNIIVNKDITLSPILKSGSYARFYSNGGSPIQSQFIDINGKVFKPTDPTKKGYTFDGWYKDPAFNQEFNFNAQINSDVDIYAKWVPAQTEYSIVYYIQNGSNDNYSFYTSRQVTGITGQSVQLSSSEREYIINATKINNYARYFINEEKLTEEIAAAGTIESDDSTVLKVYLDRVYYYIRFQGVDYKVKWGQPLKPLLSEPVFLPYAGSSQFILTYNGRYVYNIKPNKGESFMNPSQLAQLYGSEIPMGIVFNASYNGNYEGPYRLRQYHYRETLDSTEENKIYVEEIYNHTHHDSNATYTPSDSSKWKIVNTEYYSSQTGRSYLGVGTDENGTYRFLMIWYDRQLYDLTFIGTTTTVIEDIMWGKNISSYAPNETTMVRDGITYKFAGWFKDEAYFNEFNIKNNVMTDKDLTLYAKWEPLKSKVTFDPNFGDNTGTFDGDTEVVVNTGNKVEEPVKPIKNANSDDNFRYVFLGWELNGKPYDFSSPVTEDITLKAIWGIEPIPTYKVTYNLGDGTGNVKDNNKYLMSSKARVLLGSITAPLNSYFVYWKDSNGSIYYPNQLLDIIDKDVTLLAIYNKLLKVSLIYNLNYDRFGISMNTRQLDDSIKDLLENSKVKLRNPYDYEIPEGYTFGGWYLDKECTGNSITRVIIDNNNPLPNMVYAKWIPIPEEGTGSTDGSKEVIETVARTVLNPNTGDNISLYIMLFILSIIGMSSTVLIKK